MSGIIGIAKPRQGRLVREALGRIAHRGGAGTLVRSRSRATLGWTWPQAQTPMAIGADRHQVVLDGEIHNWPELAPGATCALEALQQAYRNRGPEFVAHVDGPFALALAGPAGLFLARDFVGKSPLYLAWCQGTLCFGSEIKALLGIAEHIKEFPPGHYWQPGEGLVPFARIQPGPALQQPAQELATALCGRLVSSVRKRLATGEVGAWLSGGLDSAAMVALARRQQPTLHTFSVGLEGAPDLGCARAVADFVGADHHERVCTLEELIAVLPTVIYHLESFDALLVRSSVMNFLVAELAAHHVSAVLSGEGGDELLAGYSYLKRLRRDALPAELTDITGRLHNTALQRVDRCSASHGLVARTAFLDREVVDFALRIPPEYKIRRRGRPVEKWILRVTLDGLLPEEIVWRPKSKFWEGSGIGDLLAAHAEDAISDSEFEREHTLPGGLQLHTKEELFYYRIFREQLGDQLDPAIVGRTRTATPA